MEMEHNILEPGANEDGTEWNREWNGREQAPVIKKCGRRGKETRKKEEGGNGDVKKFPFSSLSLSFGLKARKWRKNMRGGNGDVKKFLFSSLSLSLSLSVSRRENGARRTRNKMSINDGVF